MKQILFKSTVIFGFISFIFSQQTLPQRTDIKYQIISDTLNMTMQPQTIILTIVNESKEQLKAFQLSCEESDVQWTIIQALLNGKNMWLIQSDQNPMKENVLAWTYDRVNKYLIINQENISSPANLELTIQLNLTENFLSKKKVVDNIILEALTLTGLYNCDVLNGNNKIFFK